MPSVYCPQSACGSKITYEAVKPTVCPRCKKSFASAFAPKGVAKPKPAVTRARVEPDEVDANVMTPYDPNAVAPIRARMEDTDDDDDQYTDPNEARQIADQLAASINVDIMTDDLGDDAIFSFGDLMNGANRGRGAKSRR